MKVAITYKDEEVFQHFGHTEFFKIYEIEDSKITNSKVVSTNGKGHGELATFLKESEVSALICGGIGSGAINALQAANIKVYGGCSGSVTDRINEYLNNTLVFNSNPTCNHHDANHKCGSGNHSCSSN